jgi:hypothetical protein
MQHDQQETKTLRPIDRSVLDRMHHISARMRYLQGVRLFWKVAPFIFSPVSWRLSKTKMNSHLSKWIGWRTRRLAACSIEAPWVVQQLLLYATRYVHF